MNSIIGGNSYFDVPIPQFAKTQYSVIGFTLASTGGQAGSFGIRKDGHMQITPITRVDAAGKEQTDAYMVKGDLELWQTDYDSFKQCYLLSKQLVQLAWQSNDTDWFNLFENTANPPFAGTSASPNGTRATGLTWTYTCANKELSNKLMFETKLHPLEYDYLVTSGGAAFTTSGVTGTGVTTVSLSAMSYSQNNYGVPGQVTMTVSGDNIGLFSDDTKVTIKSVAPVKDAFERPLSKFIEVEIDGKALQGRFVNELQPIAGHRNQDFTVNVLLWNGITLSFVNSLSFVGAPDFSDSKAEVPFKLKGKIAYDGNVAATAGTYINFVDGTKTIVFTRSVYN